MSRSIMFTAWAASVCFAAATFAQAPAGAPAGSTGLCKDGTYYSGATKKGACRGHKGVQDWYAAADSASAATAAPSAPKVKKTVAAAPMAASTAPAAGATGMCKDGTYYSGATKKGACRGHKGVKDWYAAAEAESAAAPATASMTKAAPAAAPAPMAASSAPPAGATGMCKDGTYYSGATKKGACRGHKGVKDWYAAAEAESAAPPPAAAMTKAAPAAAPAPIVPTAAPMAAAPPKSTYAPPAMAAPGGGAGQVWANKMTKVYHCSTDRWYGKTKEGVYMSEADAKAQGFHADHGKACQ